MTRNEKDLEVGDLIQVRNTACRIYAIRGMGTVDCASLDDKNHYRVSGLAMASAEAMERIGVGARNGIIVCGLYKGEDE